MFVSFGCGNLGFDGHMFCGIFYGHSKEKTYFCRSKCDKKMKKKAYLWTTVVVFCGFMMTACFSGKLITAARVETTANQIWTYSLSHPDGFTMDLRTMTEPTEGICVAYAATQGCHSREALDYVITHAMKHNGFVGGWLDITDSLYYFDSSRIFPEDSLAAAKKFGIENGQIAIFIISEGKEIRLQ